MKMVYLVKNVFRRHVLCPLGKHDDRFPDGRQGNFCEACGKQTNPKAFKVYDVYLKDGDVMRVSAVNEMHAKSVVVYGDDNRIDARTKQPLGTRRIHPSNIIKVVLLTDY